MATQLASKPLDYRRAKLDDVLRMFIDQNQNSSDVEDLTTRIYSRMEADKAFMDAYFAEILYDFAEHKAREYFRDVRQSMNRGIDRRMAKPSLMEKKSDGRLRDFVNMSIKAYPLPGGKRLGSATFADLVQANEYHSTHAREHGWKSRWYASIAQALEGEEGDVDSKFTDEQLLELREAARAK